MNLQGLEYKTCGGDPRKFTDGCAECADRKQRDDEIAKLVESTAIATKAILAVTGGKKPISGRIDCPVCGSGKLAYAIHRNGHIHGQCETADCVHWMN